MTSKASTKSCALPQWNAARELLEGADAAVLFRHPTIAPTNGNWFLLGNDIPTLLQPVNPHGRLAIWTTNRGLVPAPSGDFTFVNPQAIVDTEGRLHVLWGEPQKQDTSHREAMWAGINVGSIWTASLDSAHHWSAPEQLYVDSGVVLWDAALADRIFVDGAGRAAIAIPTIGAAESHTLLVLFDGRTWRATPLPIKAVATSALTHGDTIVVAYLAAAEGAPRDVNSVFVVRSPDAGRSWESPELVWRSGTRPAQSLRLRMTSDGALHLFWAQQDSSGVAVLRHFVQHRRTEVWTPLEHLVLDGGFNALEVVADGCGRIHILFENYPRMGPEGSLTFATWPDTWSKPANLFGNWRPMDPALQSLPDGRLVLTMLARLGPDPLHPTYRQLWVETP